MEWQSGSFHRHKARPALKPFVPVHAVDRLEDISLTSLWDEGKRLILLDVDNTIVQWKSHGVQPGVISWLRQAEAVGFRLCMISNTKRPQRLAELSRQLNVPALRGRFKPSRHMYRKALREYSVHPDQAVMVGDQILTDVWGANRTGIDAIWVKRMQGKEFKGTAINRRIEKMLSGPIYRLLATTEDDPRNEPAIRTEQQLLRFAVVGSSSFLLDYLITKIIIDWSPVGATLGKAALPLLTYAKGPLEAAIPIAGVIAGVIATYNSFVWNRIWTFEAEGIEDERRQLVKFFVVAGGGIVIATLVKSVIYRMLPVHQILIPNVCGAIVGAAWNFTVQRAWTFRKVPA